MGGQHISSAQSSPPLSKDDYDEARANVAVALRSLEDRGPGHAVPAERQRTLEELKRELAILRTQPAR